VDAHGRRVDDVAEFVFGFPLLRLNSLALFDFLLQPDNRLFELADSLCHPPFQMVVRV
jgi:hypothetical protein